MRCVVGLLLLLLLPGLASAQADSHAAIEQERRALEKTFEAELRECQTRFAVSDCTQQARRHQRAALKPLHEREMRLEDADRQRRAEERRQSLAEKARVAAQRPAPAPPTDLRLRKPAGVASAARGLSRAASAATAPTRDVAAIEAARVKAEREVAAESASHAREKATERSDAAAQARLRVEAAKQREAEAAEVRTRVERKQADRWAKGKPTAPLPVPAASAIRSLP